MESDPRASLPHRIATGQTYKDTRSDHEMRLVFLDEEMGVFRYVDKLLRRRDIHTDKHRVETRADIEKNVNEGRFEKVEDSSESAQSRLDLEEVLALARRMHGAWNESESRKDDHKAEAMREFIDALKEEDVTVEVETDGTSREKKMDTEPEPEPKEAETPTASADGGSDKEVPFEDIPQVGATTAENLRDAGYVTESDVGSASDSELLSIGGVGQGNLSNIKEYISNDEDSKVPYETIDQLGAKTAERLRDAGYRTVGDVKSASDEELLEISGVGQANLSNLREYVR